MAKGRQTVVLISTASVHLLLHPTDPGQDFTFIYLIFNLVHYARLKGRINLQLIPEIYIRSEIGAFTHVSNPHFPANLIGQGKEISFCPLLFGTDIGLVMEANAVDNL